MDAEKYLLNNLKDIYMPERASIFPLAPGWVVLIIILFLILIMFIYIAIKKAIKNRVIGEYKRVIEKIKTTDKLFVKTSIFIKRISLYYLKDEKVKNLTSKNWIEYIETKGKIKIPESIKTKLKDAAYKKIDEKNNNKNKEEILIKFTKKWIKRVA